MKTTAIFSKLSTITLILTAIFTANILMGCAAQTASVQQGDPAKSFFRDQVTYPYKVKYADAKSNDGTVWNMGYMDVAPLFEPNPKVLVLIHGRAFSGAYFGNIVKIAHEHGIRVVVPDLPNYGKSIPGNLGNPLVRSMQQTREVVHDLVVNHLGIPKATYGGHSLGGQFVLGYALSYPEAVEGIILIAPAGLEELPAKHFPPELAQSTHFKEFVRFPYYTRKARFDFSKSAKLIEDFFYYRLKINGKLIPMGFFKTDTPDTRLATDIRTKMITGNPVEFQRHCITSLRDVYALGVEIKKEDPSSLFKQYDRIRAPILLIFGDEEPFYPKKISGLKDLKKDMIKPFYRRMTGAGCPVTVKIYPGCGHFPHTDLPDQFADDAVRFVETGEAPGADDPNGF
ncbi:MAG: alpha/beta hydrolase [Deltaproteobacteria bacterium]|nr:alpha/beta hydrolase [Deltaproteobacteria bacterium]